MIRPFSPFTSKQDSYVFGSKTVWKKKKKKFFWVNSQDMEGEMIMVVDIGATLGIFSWPSSSE